MSKVLVVNAGSSSIKVALLDSVSYELIASGIAERIGLPMGNINFEFKSKHKLELPLANHSQAISAFLKL